MSLQVEIGGGDGARGAKPPNLLLIITDQQRRAMHWPEQPGWLEALTPADAEIARTGVSFSEATVASCMCSPSRASLLTGRWPAEHGVTLTLTQGGARVQPANAPSAIRQAVGAVLREEMSAVDAVRTLAKGATRKANGGEDESELDPETPNLATILGRAGYQTVLKGKWHLTQPVEGEWSAADSRHLAEQYSLQGWEPPDAGENLEPTHFGGGTLAGREKLGYDEDFTRQVERFLADPPPEPWALIASLVNPHDVLAFPSTYEEGGYANSDWADIEGIELPASVDENLSSKPKAHAMMSIGQASFIGAVGDDAAKLEYCRFYAHLQRLADEKVGRMLAALGDPDDDSSLRSRTLIVRTSDHGEMGMSHGGLRQKMFNAYEETVNVPLIVSNPVLFSEPVTVSAPASLCDILPTVAAVAGVDVSADGVRGRDLTPVLARAATPDRRRLADMAVDFAAIADHPEPADSVQEFTHFTFDDHQSGSAYIDVLPQPNRIRSVRTPGAMYAVYVDPSGEQPPQFELYDMERDPDQVANLVDRSSCRVLCRRDLELRDRMHAALLSEMERCGTTLPVEPAGGLP
jgi:arylsulfatase A-like enzyme